MYVWNIISEAKNALVSRAIISMQDIERVQALTKMFSHVDIFVRQEAAIRLK